MAARNDRTREEPAKTVAWVWARSILTDAKSKVELIADITDNDKLLAGLRVDWRNDTFRFSEPNEYGGFKYPSKCVLYKRDSGKQWFFHESVSLERLKETSQRSQEVSREGSGFRRGRTEVSARSVETLRFERALNTQNSTNRQIFPAALCPNSLPILIG